MHRYVYRRFRRPTWIPSLMECKDTNESKKLSNRAQISCAVRARMHQGRQWTQTLRTPTVLELEDLRLDDKTIDETILSSLLRGVRRGPLRESFGAKLRAACMTAMISGPRYGSTSELLVRRTQPISRTKTIHVALRIIPRTGEENVHTSEGRPR